MMAAMRRSCGKRGVMVGVNDSGHAVGEDHKNCKFKNWVVDLVRELRETHGLTFGKIVLRLKARGIHMSRSNVAQICAYKTRTSCAMRYTRR